MGRVDGGAGQGESSRRRLGERHCARGPLSGRRTATRRHLWPRRRLCATAPHGGQRVLFLPPIHIKERTEARVSSGKGKHPESASFEQLQASLHSLGRSLQQELAAEQLDTAVARFQLPNNGSGYEAINRGTRALGPTSDALHLTATTLVQDVASTVMCLGVFDWCK